METSISIKCKAGLTEIEYTYYPTSGEFTISHSCGMYGSTKPSEEKDLPEVILDCLYKLNSAEFDV